MPRYPAILAFLLIILLTGCGTRQSDEDDASAATVLSPPTAIVSPPATATASTVAAATDPASTPFVSPLATVAVTTEEVTPPSTVQCVFDGETARCTDKLLDLAFVYPLFMGEIVATELRPGWRDGIFYEYDFSDEFSHTKAGAGGRSRDFDDARGGMSTDQLGYGERPNNDYCVNDFNQICEMVRPGVAFTTRFPQAKSFCGGFPLVVMPQILIPLNLPAHPLVHGFGFAAPLFPPEMPEMEVQFRNEWPEMSSCTTKQQAAFDASMAQLRMDLESGLADPAVQTRYDAMRNLAATLQGPYLGDDRMRSPQEEAAGRTFQAVVTALLLSDADGLKELVHYMPFGCTEGGALGGPPQCRAGETPGDLVDALPVLGVEGVAVRPDEIDSVMQTLIDQRPALVSIVTEPQESSVEPRWLPGRYAALLWGGSPPVATALLVDSEGIVRIYNDATLEQLGRRVFAPTSAVAIRAPDNEIDEAPAMDAVPSLEPQILEFRAAPTMTASLGETIVVEWQAAGESAELCWLNGAGPTTCQPVPLTGSATLTVDEATLAMTGIGLKAMQDAEFVWATADLAIQCVGLRDWFFADPPLRCPEADTTISPAAAQFFENGFMIWTETPDVFYVFLDDQARAQGNTLLRFAAPYDFGPEQAVLDPPPADRLAPVSGFGRLWRGELTTPLDNDLRNRLGWALGPEFAFESAFQCEMREHPRSWTCYLQTPDDRVLRLWPDSTAQANLLWREYGND